jgi:hypothetical protein
MTLHASDLVHIVLLEEQFELNISLNMRAMNFRVCEKSFIK